MNKHAHPIAWLSASLLATAVQMSFGAAPELSGASITVSPGEPWLLYGVALDSPKLAVFVAGSSTNEMDALPSLRRHLAGPVPRPENPPPGAVKVSVIKADAFTAAMEAPKLPPGSRRPVLVWAENAEGVSRPLVLNRPEIWTVTPRQAAPGESVRLFGPNLGDIIGLADAAGVVLSCEWGRSHTSEKGYTALYERTLRVPTNAAAGPARVYVNHGAGDDGWSEAAALDVVAPAPPASVRHVDAPADGGADATPAIQQAIEELTAQGGGIVFLKPGLYRLNSGLSVRSGVTLRGAGTRATTLLPAEGRAFAAERGRRALVTLSGRSTLEHLSLDASDAEDCTALVIRGGTNLVVRHCEITALRPIDRPAGKYVNTERVMTVEGNVENLVLLNNRFRGPNCFGNASGGVLGAWIAHNVFEGLPSESMNVRFWDLRESLFEHNVIRNGGRGLVVQIEAVRNAFLHNRIENTHGAGNGCESFLYEMGGVRWHGTPSDLKPDSFAATGTNWAKPAFVSSATGVPQRMYVVVTAGRGMGQSIPVRELAGAVVRLARPWTLPPDAGSKVALMTGCIENLHIENQIVHGRAYSGIFGAGLRNIWAGEELDDMANGLVLWSITEGRQMSLNLVRNVRISNGEGLKFIASYEGPDDGPLVHAFGNEFRACQFYDIRRVPGNEYGPGNTPWRWPFNQTSAGNARHPVYGWEAGMHFSVQRRWPGMDNDDDPKLDAESPRIRWTLFWDNLVHEAPVGLRLGRGIENTVVDGQVTVNARRPLWDSGRGTQARSVESRHGPAAEPK